MTIVTEVIKAENEDEISVDPTSAKTHTTVVESKKRQYIIIRIMVSQIFKCINFTFFSFSDKSDEGEIDKETKKKRTESFLAHIGQIMIELPEKRRKCLEREISALAYKAEDEVMKDK